MDRSCCQALVDQHLAEACWLRCQDSGHCRYSSRTQENALKALQLVLQNLLGISDFKVRNHWSCVPKSEFHRFTVPPRLDYCVRICSGVGLVSAHFRAFCHARESKDQHGSTWDAAASQCMIPRCPLLSEVVGVAKSGARRVRLLSLQRSPGIHWPTRETGWDGDSHARSLDQATTTHKFWREGNRWAPISATASDKHRPCSR